MVKFNADQARKLSQKYDGKAEHLLAKIKDAATEGLQLLKVKNMNVKQRSTLEGAWLCGKI